MTRLLFKWGPEFLSWTVPPVAAAYLLFLIGHAINPGEYRMWCTLGCGALIPTIFQIRWLIMDHTWIRSDFESWYDANIREIIKVIWAGQFVLASFVFIGIDWAQELRMVDSAKERLSTQQAWKKKRLAEIVLSAREAGWHEEARASRECSVRANCLVLERDGMYLKLNSYIVAGQHAEAAERLPESRAKPESPFKERTWARKYSLPHPLRDVKTVAIYTKRRGERMGAYFGADCPAYRGHLSVAVFCLETMECIRSSKTFTEDPPDEISYLQGSPPNTYTAYPDYEESVSDFLCKLVQQAEGRKIMVKDIERW